MNRGDVYDTRLDPTEGSEEGGFRPVVIVSRDAINAARTTVIAIPCTTYRPGTHLYASNVLLHAPDGGLRVDSIALCDQIRVLAKSRLLRRRGVLAAMAMAEIDQALLVTLDLPGQP